MSTLTDADLARLEVLEAECDGAGRYSEDIFIDAESGILFSQAEAAYIAAACNAVPTLVAEVSRLRAEMAAAKKDD